MQVGLVVAMVVALGSCSFILGVLIPNEFVIDGTSYEVTKAYAVNWGLNVDGNYDIEIYLVPDTISIGSDGFLIGQGDYAWFWINTAAPVIGENSYPINTGANFIPTTLYNAGVVRDFGKPIPFSDSLNYLESGGVLDISTTVLGDEFIFDYVDGALITLGSFEAFFRGELDQPLITASPSVVPSRSPLLQRAE